MCLEYVSGSVELDECVHRLCLKPASQWARERGRSHTKGGIQLALEPRPSENYGCK